MTKEKSKLRPYCPQIKSKPGTRGVNRRMMWGNRLDKTDHKKEKNSGPSILKAQD